MEDSLRIRNLDFINPRNKYNEARETYEEYDSRQEQDCFIREHKIDAHEEDSSNPNRGKSVVLSISCFQDGGVSQFVKHPKSAYDYYTIKWNELALSKFEKTGNLKAILAYKLDLVPQGNIPPTVLVQDVSTAEKELASGHALTGKTLDPILTRNLEHILSVCSIPVTSQKTGKSAIAFTCGDIDGHRVATAASFYCFQFLLLAWKHFDSRMPSQGSSEEEPRYARTMRDRIRRVCEGHLIWLFQMEEKPFNFLCPHRWVNGESIENWEDNEYLPTKALVHTPFQIIKAGDFHETFQSIDASVKDSVRIAIAEWIKSIDHRNKLGLYAFPSYKKEETNNFYLTDHVMIWRAARSAEGLGLREELKVLTKTPSKKAPQKQHPAGRHISNQQSGQKYGRPKLYFADVVQSNILKRFTTENPVSKKRMIAVSRSPAQTRFLLRTKDASLFHAMNLGLFNKPGTKSGYDNWHNIIDVWKNTIDCQIAHEDNDDTWDEPLRLDENNEPALYESEVTRDTYWSVTFEVPYLLWKYFWPAKRTPPIRSDGITEPTKVGGHQPVTLGNNTHIPPTGSGEQQAAIKMTASSRGNSMKRTFPFNNMVDQDNIVELTDEWLYNEPTFFVSSQKSAIGNNDDDDVHGNTNTQESGSVSQHDVTEEDFDPYTDMEAYLKEDISYEFVDELQYEDVIYEFVDELQDEGGETPNQSSQSENSTMPASSLEFLGVMVDVPKSKHLKKSTRSLEDSIQEVTTRKILKRQMENGRTPEKAKKRFWGFFAKEPLANEICCATSPINYTSSNCNQEGQELVKDKELSVYQERHKSYDKFFSDDPAPTSNSWTTELHISFYGVDKTHSCKAIESTMEATKKDLLLLPGLEEGDSTQLSRVAMSFRFDGDFFDRYWTCWYLVADPGTETTKNTIVDEVNDLLEGELKEKKNVNLKKQPWRQRRILELLLFDKIICQMHSYANKILEQAKSGITKKTKDPGKISKKIREETEGLDYDEFVKQRKLFGNFQEALQAVQDDLNENLNIVDRWLNREKDRQGERPRWTFNDESRYRSIISKMVICNEHNIQELKRSHSKIKSFNDLLTKKVDTMRNDVDQRRADDIQRFTYVTVVFLPLGFATGVFSMSEAPASQTLVYMILVAIGALLTIYILLENMKRIEDIYKLVSKPVRKASETIISPMCLGLDLFTDKWDCLVQVWQGWMEVIGQCCNRRVKRPHPEEGTAEGGTPIASHD
ncbi:hypothetical protein H9Q72_012136 [Fusarium xylarioides]|uniref:Mg2+ transporter zinc transport protein n=1 Tax=Fusarium xylarioides TaxID=221167 RepID=A0A9P7HI19_9HYPO|nr:hypothetical protein H9Q72_012136 [Fusarium xylarioides]